MAHVSRRRNQSSKAEQTSKISQDKGQVDHSSYQIDDPDLAAKVAAANAAFDWSELARIVREKFGYGHPAFNDLAISMMRLHSEKNRAYAGGGTPLGNFDRNASIFKNYPTFPYASPEGFLMCLVMKHFDAIMWALNTGRKPPEDACADISVYMNILRCMLQYPEALQAQPIGR